MQSTTCVADGGSVATKSRAVKRTANSKLIRKALIDRGWSVTQLARRIRRHRVNVSFTIHGNKRGSDTIQAQVARALGLGIEEAFPLRAPHGRGTRTSTDGHGYPVTDELKGSKAEGMKRTEREKE